MKIITIILTFYFVLLTGVSTLRVVKSHFSDCCEALADNGCCQSDEVEGCQKEKCVLNLNFSAGQFIVQQIQNISISDIFDDRKQEKLNYDKTFISNYYSMFWHPPEKAS